MTSHASLPEPPGGAPPFKSRVSAYKELLQALNYAYLQFKEKGDGGREGVRLACQAVARFIAVRHEDPQLAAPLLAMRQALIDHDRGIESELFAKPTKRSRSGLKAHLKCCASVCLEVLVERGEPLGIAAAKVARHVAKWPSIGEQKISATTVQNWREAERRHSGAEREDFDNLRKHILSQADPVAVVKRFLDDGPPDAPRS
jgi:hypothetical protein